MKLWAVSDLHLGYAANRQALEELPAHPGDWLIVAGDVGESTTHLDWGLEALTRRFERVLWVPGNHELWAWPRNNPTSRGEEKYAELVEVCRARNVLTPEDPYPIWPGPSGNGGNVPIRIALLFLLYDYSFRPDSVPLEESLRWAMAFGLVSADEALLDPYPHASREAWCAERCRLTEERLSALPPGEELVLVNHFPLRRELARLPLIPRFSVWCGTRRTEDWHVRFRARVVVSGHVHIRATTWRDGVRFEEVSLGYPRQWKRERGLLPYLREILPGPAPPRTA